jgi:hypothetical protein
MKNHVIFLLLGALLGAAAASVIVPPGLSWYASPGGMPKEAEMQVIVKVPEVIHYATSKLIIGQAIGAGIGAVACFVLSLVLASKRRKPAAA